MADASSRWSSSTPARATAASSIARSLRRARAARSPRGVRPRRHAQPRRRHGAAARSSCSSARTPSRPASDWLRRDLGAASAMTTSIAGVYGRQLPHDGASPPEHYFLGFLYGHAPRARSSGRRGELSMATTLFSNANSAIRRDVWEEFPVRRRHDHERGPGVVAGGCCSPAGRLAYEPRPPSATRTAYTIGAAFQRFFDSGVSAERAYLAPALAARVLRANARPLRPRRASLAVALTATRSWIPYACGLRARQARAGSSSGGVTATCPASAQAAPHPDVVPAHRSTAPR